MEAPARIHRVGREETNMEKKTWCLLEPGPGLRIITVVTAGEQAARMVSSYTDRPHVLALLAVKSYRKFRGRTYNKAVGELCKYWWGDDPYSLKARITRGAVVVLKTLERGCNRATD